jgi:hypothetical protein
MVATFRIPQYVRSVIDADGAVLLDVRRGKYYSLNGVAAEIWRRLEAGQALPEIETDLTRTYEASGETLHRDLMEFLDRLTQGQLIDAHD